MSTTRFLLYLFVSQLLGPAMIVLFGFLGMPVEAAGPAFVLLGLGMVMALGMRHELRVSALMFSLVLYTLSGLGLSLAHLSHWGTGLNEYTLAGLPASYAHHGVEALYMLAVFLTLAYTIWFRLRPIQTSSQREDVRSGATT